jgi:hypothetical protein
VPATALNGSAEPYVIETGLPMPDIRGGQPKKPNLIREAVQALLEKGVPTPDGEASALWFPGVTERTLPIRSALNKLGRLGAEFDVTVVKHWELSSRGNGRNFKEGSQIVFWLIPRMPPPMERRTIPRKRGATKAKA